MSTVTKRWVYLCMLLSLIAVPFALVSSDLVLHRTAQDAARSWAVSLSDREKVEASRHVADYPRAYRKALLTELPPAARAQVWRGFLSRYLREHESLRPHEVDAVKEALELMTPELFIDRPSGPRADAIRSAADAVRRELGDSAARELLADLGPAHLVSSPALSLRTRVGDALRNQFVLEAAESCQCAEDFWGCSSGMHCEEGAGGCTKDTTWPACGLLWMDDCIGLCTLNSNQ